LEIEFIGLIAALKTKHCKTMKLVMKIYNQRMQ